MEVVITTTSVATNDDKVGIGFQRLENIYNSTINKEDGLIIPPGGPPQRYRKM